MLLKLCRTKVLTSGEVRVDIGLFRIHFRDKILLDAVNLDSNYFNSVPKNP